MRTRVHQTMNSQSKYIKNIHTRVVMLMHTNFLSIQKYFLLQVLDIIHPINTPRRWSTCAPMATVISLWTPDQYRAINIGHSTHKLGYIPKYVVGVHIYYYDNSGLMFTSL